LELENLKRSIKEIVKPINHPKILLLNNKFPLPEPMAKKELKNAMSEALKIANEKATSFGAVLIDKNFKVIAAAANSSSTDGMLAHAEMNLLNSASSQLGDLSPYTLVSTCEPCPMCMSAILWHGIEKVYFGASIEDAAKYISQIHIKAKEIVVKSGKKGEVEGGVMREKCLDLFEVFYSGSGSE
jgi:tRNA(Arg) A34 adenosine deaminase TadA